MMIYGWTLQIKLIFKQIIVYQMRIMVCNAEDDWDGLIKIRK